MRRTPRHRIVAVVVVPALVAVALATNALPASSLTRAKAKARTAESTVVASDAMPAGPYAVGVTHVTYADATRGRTIAVTLRYPVMAGPAADNDVDDEAIGEIANVGTYPLVVLAHGYDVSAATYAALEHQLAAAGFVVAAPDFPETSSAVTDDPNEDDVANQAADVSFVITELTTAATMPDVLSGAIADTPVGVVGHSDGGVTAAAVAYNSSVADPRVGAAVILSGAEARYDGTWFTTQSPPLLAIHGTADEVNPLTSSEQLYDDATGSKLLVTVDGGSHLGPFTTDATEPAVATLAADFLRAHLLADPAAGARLGSDANVAGELTLAAAA